MITAMRKTLTTPSIDQDSETKPTQMQATEKNCDLSQSQLQYSGSRRFILTQISEAEKTRTSELVFKMWTVIHPNSRLKRTWDLILIFLLLYVALIMPYRIAFIEGKDFDDWWWLDNVINFLFFCDFLINCLSAYYDENDRLIFSNKKIFLNYLKGWLLIDLISCLPFDQFLESDKNSAKYNSLLRLFRLPRLYRLVRISKIFKLMQQYRNSDFLQKLQDFVNIKQSVARLIGVFFSVLASIHIFACFWAFVPKLEGYELKTWVMKGGFYDNDQYILSIYWCIVTFSTVGYGDITPGTTFEIIITIFWMIFGICFYSFIIGSLASILSSLETKETILVKKLAAIDEFSKETNLNKDLKIKIRTFVKSSAEFEGFRWSDKKSVFFELPKNLRYEIAQVMHKGSANFLNFFKYRNSTFISSVVPFLSHKIVAKEKFIYQTGDYADEIYFLLRGKILIISQDEPPELAILNMLPGGCFGDVEVVKKIDRVFGVKTEAKCSLLIMNYELLEFIQDNFKSVWNELVSQAHQNDLILQSLNRNARIISCSGIPSLKSLKDINVFAETLAKDEFNEAPPVELLTDSADEIVQESMEKIQACLVSINKDSESINKILNEVIERLKPRPISQVSSFTLLTIDHDLP